MRFSRILAMARFELFGAIRSRRALVVFVLYLAASLLSMNGAITVLGKIESQLVEVLQLPSEESQGVISQTLWQSKRFQGFVRSALNDSLIYDDICGKHPAELIYAWFTFFYIPLLTILIAGNRAAEELHSGSIRYVITRITRLEWSLGKFVGLAGLLLLGMFIGAAAAWTVAAARLSGADIPALFPSMLIWGGKAWIYSLSWLGLALGISHLMRSGSKATALGIVMLIVCSAAPLLIKRYAEEFSLLAYLFPGAAENSLWRSSLSAVTSASLWLIAVGLLYLSAGIAYFLRRDAR